MKNILVRSPNWIGDQILAYPFFHYLRNAYPRARIGVTCVPWVQSLQFRNLVDEVIPLEKPEDPGLMGRFKNLEESAKAIRERGPWDMGIILPNSFSAAWMFFRAGVSHRRGYNTDSRKLLLNDAVHWPTQSIEHRAQAYVNLLPDEVRPKRPVSEFWGIPAENELDDDIPGEVEFFDAKKAWPDAEVLEPPKGDYWVLAPGSQAESRRWPIEKFADLAREIAQTKGWTGVVVGGLAESRLAETLCEDPELKLIDMTAQGPVPSLWKIFSGAKFSVCNDSGLAHVAALCGSPVEIVWGAGDPKRTRPIGRKKVQMIFQPTECWPCERNTCRLPAGRQLECLRGIQPEAVWKEIQSGIRP
ncbi:MAG: lipopolysaccharide heptosyltransferase II [Bdellovibrionia bacterium]